MLFPESHAKSLSLSGEFHRYLDIRRVYSKLLNNNENLTTLHDIMTGSDG